MALISCKNVSMSYENNTVFSGLTFDVKKGDYLCIVGENGSGKSTLMKGLLGLKSPDAGTIDYSDGLKKTEIGYLPQQTGIQKDFPASVHEIVLSGCLGKTHIGPFYSKSEKALAMKNIKLLGIENLKKRCYRELSGGQQQRVLLARALCATEKLIILDEPISGLDPLASSEMYAMIKKLNREDGITVIMVSHDIKCSIADAKKILHLEETAAFFGTVEEYILSELGSKFLGD